MLAEGGHSGRLAKSLGGEKAKAPVVGPARQMERTIPVVPGTRD